MHDTSRDRWLALNYAAAIFTSAFLLFQVQPLVSKHILPWFGGGAAVWSTCLLFFQTMLFFGYAYAHFIHSHFRPRQQAMVHIGLIVAALAFARILPGARWQPLGGEDPVPSILLILLVSVGLPYFVLAATGPLLQAWFARTFPGRTPYRLYALSNVGSLLALLSYPFFFERHFSIPRQAQIWTVGFLIYAALCCYAAWRLWTPPGRVSPTRESESRRDSATCEKPRFIQRLLWLLWPMFASIVLMATSRHVSTDIAAMPFLWVVPLALYLVTFIIAFDRPTWYYRTPLVVVLLAAIYVTALIHFLNVGTNNVFDAGTLGLVYSAWQLALNPTADSPTFYISTLAFLLANLATMFGICMLCHGELYRQRPNPSYLTSYYLMIALGGALGGALVTFAAPQLFSTYYEWELGLFAATALAICFLLRALVDFAFRDESNVTRRPWHYALLALVVMAIFLPSAIMLIDLIEFLQPATENAELRLRNFYGAITVYDRYPDDPQRRYYHVRHGRITHGAQYAHPDRRREPLTYYGRSSGIARTIDYYRRELDSEPMRVGVVGLGTGTVAAFVDGGDAVTFYEIDSDVRKLAENSPWFTYLNDCRQRGARCDVRIGDARLTLQRELAVHSSSRSGEGAEEGNRYHLLVLDAFSGDSIPAHLLTVEAFDLYLAHLGEPAGEPASAGGESGAIVIHISNRFLDLKPLVYGLANHFGLHAIRIDTDKDDANVLYAADWMILTRNEKLTQELSHFAKPNVTPRTLLWTDAHSSLLDVLK